MQVNRLLYSIKKSHFELLAIMKKAESIVFVPVFSIPAKVAANGRMALWGNQIL